MILSSLQTLYFWASNYLNNLMLLLIILIVLILLGYIAIKIFMGSPQFGAAPSGARLEAIKLSPNYRDDQFQNLSPTPQLTDGATMPKMLGAFLLGRGKSERNKPKDILPSQKTDLLHLDKSKDVLVWFGHSSYFMQVDGLRILVDPVFSGSASPIKATTRSFPGSDVYTVDDMPTIDILFITHDHWDHLDHKTVLKLKNKVGKVITSLGVGAHLERWGYNKAQIIEADWNSEIKLDNGIIVNTAPARHFSGRTFKRNGTTWSSFILTTPTMRIYLGGDSGYDTHFKTIGDQYGPFDLVILESGQYNKSWKYIHMMPEETVQAAQDLKAKKLLNVHWGKFALALHAWDEPAIRVAAASSQSNLPQLTPMIGEMVDLKGPITTSHWWESVK